MITPWFPRAGAPGSGVFVLRDAKAVMRSNEVTVVHLDSEPGASERAGRDDVDGVPVLRIPLKRMSPISRRRAARRIADLAQEAGAVHTHSLTGLHLFAFRRPAGRTRWVHTEHWSGVTAPETLGWGMRLLRRVLMPILARPDVVVVAAERLATVIRRVRRGPIVRIPCVVTPPARLREAPRDPAALRLVGVGGLIERKGPMLALETVIELDRRGVVADLTWVGEGPLREDLERTARERGFANRLTLTGARDEAGVGDALDAGDLFILPTQGDNFCIVVAEALTHGRPVVSGAETGAVDYADSSVSEFVDIQSPVAYADAVLRVRAKAAHLSADDIASTVEGAFSPSRVERLLLNAYSGARTADD